ncbi:hypothetical protein [Microlunatus speluncae]|uniref:hypothetical protein n=1 Tax=Microlunatus speluncae TaxID=2594267 RepID=UPI00126635BA|nr:hypothetical protein [Microlunatus speluncae]
MSRSVSVVVYADRPPQELSATLASIDAQTLPAAQIQVILATGSGELARRLDRYAQNRPNVVIHHNEGPPEASKHGAAALASGDWTLVLGPSVMERRARVLPEALERLTRYAEEHDLDRLTGRVTYRSAAGILDGLFIDNAVWTGDAPDRPEPFVLYRTAVLTDPRRHTRRGGVLADYPSLYLDPHLSNTPPITRSGVAAEWVDGRLRVEVTLRTDSALTSGRRLHDQQLWFAVHHPATGLDFWLPTDAPTPVDPTAEVRVARTELDPLHAALGGPLADGVWELWISVIGPDHTGCRLRIPAAAAPSAVLDGTLVAVARHADGLAVDIGATRYPVVGALPADGAEVTESRRGSLATLMVPDLQVTGEARIRGRLHGHDSAPATLVCAEGQARIECFLSGLAGTQPLSAAFGGARPAETGLTLRIEPSGSMVIIPTPPVRRPRPVTVPAPEPSRSQTRSRPKPPPTVLTKLRHRIPGFLEPTARRLSHNPAARAFYRRVNRSLRGRI